MDLFGDLPPVTQKQESSASDSDVPTSSKRHERSIGNDIDSETVKRQKLDDSLLYILHGFLGERRGEREDMQDAHLILDNCTLENRSANIRRVACYGVFDGHAGPRASKYTAKHLPKNIMSCFPPGNVENIDKEMKKCLVEAFRKTDEQFLKEASLASPFWKDGTTVTCLLVVNNTIFSANVGDSRAVLCRELEDNNTSCVRLSKDHSPSNFEERKRIEHAGGIVRDGRVMGVLEVSRSIGDGRFKGCGVICTPDVFRCAITEKDKFVIIGCDGLWKVFSENEAVQFVIKILKDKTITLPNADDSLTNFESGHPTSLKEYRYEQACNQLAVEAVKRGCVDNVTVMIIDIFHQNMDQIEVPVT